MAADPNQLRYLAAKGHFGHAALLDPDTFVNASVPTPGTQVAQSDTNEFGFPDKLKVTLPRNGPDLEGMSSSPTTIRTQSEADLNLRLLQSGVPMEEVMAREKAARAAQAAKDAQTQE